MSDHNIEKHIRVYWNVFFALLFFTVLTVGASYLEINSVFLTFFIGLSIACIKGYLVASNFMHLNSERKAIYYILLLTVVFFFVALFMPTLWKNSADTFIEQDQYAIPTHPYHEGGH